MEVVVPSALIILRQHSLITLVEVVEAKIVLKTTLGTAFCLLVILTIHSPFHLTALLATGDQNKWLQTL